ncbi:glutaredoxin domain-containing protein [Leuconostoc citreum]|uniref:glutaredoxin domain-containing protein n=1 Tax=Leuconostoc citreum TaxID=33964 RepID=UPI0032DF2A91
MTETKNKPKKRRWLVISVGIIFSLGIIFTALKVGYDRFYNGYPDTRQVMKKISELSDDENQKTVLVFHKPGCANCLAARSTVKAAIKENAKRVNYIVINKNDRAAQDVITNYGISTYPTVVVLHGKQVVNSAMDWRGDQFKKSLMGD